MSIIQDDSEKEVFNVAVDTALDFVTKGQKWRSHFLKYKLGAAAKRWYGNILKFLLLTSVLHTGVFLFFWDKVLVLINLSITLIAIILVLDPVWIITAPESYDNLRTVKNMLYKVLDGMLVVIVIAVESLRMLIKNILFDPDITEQKKEQ